MVCVPDNSVSQQVITTLPLAEDEYKGFLVTGVPVQFTLTKCF